MNSFIHNGYGNVVNSDKVVAIVSPDAAPIKRMIQNARDNGLAIDATQGRRTKSVIVLESGQVVLSALICETIVKRLGPGVENRFDMEGDEDEP